MNDASFSPPGDSFVKRRSRFRSDAGQLLKGPAHSTRCIGNQLLTELDYLESSQGHRAARRQFYGGQPSV